MTKGQQIDLTILIPAYREEKRIGLTLDKLAKFLGKDKLMKTIRVEVMVVSADSPDKTHQIVQAKSGLFRDFSHLKPGRRAGKGRDVQYGMLRAKGKAIIFMDADLATPLAYIPKFYREYIDGSEVVAGTRNLRKHHPAFFRRSISNMGNILYRILGGVWVEDSQCGFKLFSKKAAKVCFGKMTILGWGFDMEVLTIARTNRFKISYHRIDDWRSVAGGTFEESVIKSSAMSLMQLVHIFRRRLLGRYRA